MPRLGRRRWRLILLGTVAALVVAFGAFWRASIRKNRSIPDEPFRIAGNLYYVGSTGVTSFLLTGPDGHVLIDGGYPETAPLIIASIARLGFDIADVKVLLNSHAHFDHAAGLRELQEASGAELWVSEGDADLVARGGAGDLTFGPLRHLGFGRFPAARVDHRFKDGDTIRVGPLALTAHVTAGHTRGCTSWSFPVRHGDRELLAVSICSLSLLPFMSFGEKESYPGIGADFERSFRTLRSLPADLFLGSHGSFFDLERKRLDAARAGDPAEPFIDRQGYLDFIDRAERRFREKVGYAVSENLSYEPAIGAAGTLDLYEPRLDSARTNRPAILAIHGGAWMRGDKGWGENVADALCPRGYVVFSINYRLSGRPGGTWPAQIEDVRKALRYIRANAARFRIDPERIASLGLSAGGHLATMAALRDDPAGPDGRVRVAVNLAGEHDMTMPPDQVMADFEHIMTAVMGHASPWSDAELRDISTVTFARPDVSLLSVHGAGDDNVYVAQAERITAALRAAGAEAELVRIEGKEGNCHADCWRVPRAMQAIHDFLDRELAHGGRRY